MTTTGKTRGGREGTRSVESIAMLDGQPPVSISGEVEHPAYLTAAWAPSAEGSLLPED